MPLLLHRAERAVVLVDELAALLGTPLPDPFTPEVIAVPAKGVERWLTQRLSTGLGAVDGDGVAANLHFPSPTRLVDDAVAAASGTATEDDPWAPQRMLWQLLDLMDSCVGEPWCAVLSHHVGHGADDHRTGRRYAAAEHLRDLFRSYEAHRPTMLVAWAAGEESGLDPDLGWQAELWRRLRTALDAPSPAERLSQTCRRLVDEPEISSLPPRLSVFGATRLSTAQRQVLRALGERRDVHLWLAHPSPAVWKAISTAPSAVTRREDGSGLLVQHPLTASLSRDVRELQLLLGDVDTVHHGSASTGTSLLAQAQAAIRDDRAPQPTATADGTVQVHACHGPPRQVEVLREALLALFQADSSLEPRDVLVMCPDIETYAPLVRAAFGQPAFDHSGSDHKGADHPGHRLRVRLADRALRQTNPLLDTLSALLELAGGRVTATQVLDLAATAPLRRQFGLDDDDLERLHDWAGRAGVRWGLGDSQREAYSLGAVRQGTWRTGLDRILLGVAADETDLGWLDLVLPLDDVDSSDIDLAGRLAELVDRLEHVLASLQGPQPLADWVLALTDALELLTAVSDADAWQLGQALRELAEAAEHGGAALLRLADLRQLMRGRLAGRPTRANFRTGALTVCTMVPMRSVPHRVIALLGLDDGVFPRGGALDGDDVLQRDPQPGERDPRSEDRQLLLDALMSAGEHLLLLYTGADPVTGATRPPAVPLGELLDVVRSTAGGCDVVRRHPLQPFDPGNFTAPPFSFDRSALAGAQAARGPRTAPAPLVIGPLPATTGDVELSALIGFVVHPAKAFLAQRLGIRVPMRQDVLTDDLRAELDPLEKWDVGERMLQARLSGVDLVDFRQAELRRGTLPPGPIALRLLSELEDTVQAMATVADPHLLGARRRQDVSRDLDGRRLTGTVSGLHGQVLVRATYSRLAPKHRLTAWVQLLAAGLPTAVTIGKGAFGRVAVSTLTLPADPLAVLGDLVALRDEGLRAPLPIATAASHAYASRRAAGDTDSEAPAAARKAWGDMFGDATDEHVRYVHGGDVDAFLGTGTRFAALARRLWDPLLAAES
ncbi:MAG: exodeoxyribonuclease V subunit gamma [Frankiales bacterium]|nr:exodeoxyribonuclease V subunit gamma [Frankiales bacterium]